MPIIVIASIIVCGMACHFCLCSDRRHAPGASPQEGPGTGVWFGNFGFRAETLMAGFSPIPRRRRQRGTALRSVAGPARAMLEFVDRSRARALPTAGAEEAVAPEAARRELKGVLGD